MVLCAYFRVGLALTPLQDVFARYIYIFQRISVADYVFRTWNHKWRKYNKNNKSKTKISCAILSQLEIIQNQFIVSRAGGRELWKNTKSQAEGK